MMRFRIKPVLIVAGAMAASLVALFSLISCIEWAYIKWEETFDIEFDLNLGNQGSRERLYSEFATQIDAPRIKMCRDIIAKKFLLGKTKAEIVDLLGQPDNYPFREPWGFNYWVGLQRGPMKMDSAWLAIRFDDTHHAVEVKMKQD
jgi:hypothetical protein